MEITFLGTGAGVPAKERNVSSIALQLLEERGQVWLFDCGEATQHQILHTSIRPRRIEKIFITHLHGDHIFGLPGLLGSRSFQGGETSVTLYGPKGIMEYVEVSLRVSKTHLKYPLSIVEIEGGVIFEDDTFSVEALQLEHGMQCFGYRIVEKDLPGTLLVDELKQIGISPGPIYKELKQGKEIVLEDGRIIRGKNFLSSPQPGRIVCILGDTRYCENSILLAKDADILVHEATFNSEDDKLAFDYYHSTTVQAATIAVNASVGQLLINHISSRYQKEECARLLQEAKVVFSNTTITNDFFTTRVERKGR